MLLRRQVFARNQCPPALLFSARQMIGIRCPCPLLASRGCSSKPSKNVTSRYITHHYPLWSGNSRPGRPTPAQAQPRLPFALPSCPARSSPTLAAHLELRAAYGRCLGFSCGLRRSFPVFYIRNALVFS